jgi:hypothetical protein
MLGKDVVPLLRALAGHGCKKCGSVPIGFVNSHSNDAKMGGIDSKWSESYSVQVATMGFAQQSIHIK